MLATETMMKTKWCTRDKTAVRNWLCKGSDCSSWTEIPEGWPQQGKGYCGLSGIPVELWIRGKDIILKE